MAMADPRWQFEPDRRDICSYVYITKTFLFLPNKCRVPTWSFYFSTVMIVIGNI